jgi:hypothetical protein
MNGASDGQVSRGHVIAFQIHARSAFISLSLKEGSVIEPSLKSIKHIAIYASLWYNANMPGTGLVGQQ